MIQHLGYTGALKTAKSSTYNNKGQNTFGKRLIRISKSGRNYVQFGWIHPGCFESLLGAFSTTCFDCIICNTIAQ